MSKRISNDIFVLWKNSHKIIYNFIIGYKISFLPDWTQTYIWKKFSFLKSNVRKYIYVFFFNVKNKMCKINVCIIFFFVKSSHCHRDLNFIAIQLAKIKMQIQEIEAPIPIGIDELEISQPFAIISRIAWQAAVHGRYQEILLKILGIPSLKKITIKIICDCILNYYWLFFLKYVPRGHKIPESKSIG